MVNREFFCNPGDTVFLLDEGGGFGKYSILEVKVKKIKITKKHTWYIIDLGFNIYKEDEDFGDTVFLEKEDAEKRLLELNKEVEEIKRRIER